MSTLLFFRYSLKITLEDNRSSWIPKTQQAIPIASATRFIEDGAKLSYIGINSFKRESFGTPANRGRLETFGQSVTWTTVLP